MGPLMGTEVRVGQQSHVVALVIARAAGQSVVTSLHSVTFQLQMLAGVVVDVV
jgi:hypothetical protein